MRRVSYKVRRKNGETFLTSDYTEAIANGNRIIRTFVTDIDEKTPAEKVWNAVHARKVWAKIAENRKK